MICENSTIITANTTEKGKGRWVLVSGSAKIVHQDSVQTEIYDIAKGKTVLKWTMKNEYCVSESKVIILNNSFDIVLKEKQNTSANSKDATIEVDVIDGNGPVSFRWNDRLAQSGNIAKNLAPGTYTVEAKDQFCVAKESFQIQ